MILMVFMNWISFYTSMGNFETIILYLRSKIEFVHHGWYLKVRIFNLDIIGMWITTFILRIWSFIKYLLKLPIINPSTLKLIGDLCLMEYQVGNIEDRVGTWEGLWHIKVMCKMSLDEFMCWKCSNRVNVLCYQI